MFRNAATRPDSSRLYAGGKGFGKSKDQGQQPSAPGAGTPEQVSAYSFMWKKFMIMKGRPDEKSQNLLRVVGKYILFFF
jgi:hypothetical protein